MGRARCLRREPPIAAADPHFQIDVQNTALKFESPSRDFHELWHNVHPVQTHRHRCPTDRGRQNSSGGKQQISCAATRVHDDDLPSGLAERFGESISQFVWREEGAQLPPVGQ